MKGLIIAFLLAATPLFAIEHTRLVRHVQGARYATIPGTLDFCLKGNGIDWDLAACSTLVTSVTWRIHVRPLYIITAA